jgi:hypothetical protein
MKRSAIALMSVCASLLMVQAAAAQSVGRQAPPRQVTGDRPVVPPAARSFNVAQLTTPERTSVARQLTGSSTLAAGATQRYGLCEPNPNGGEIVVFHAVSLRPCQRASFGSEAMYGTIGLVLITLPQSSGTFLFECPTENGNGLTWSTRVGNTNTFNEGVAPAVNNRALFVIDFAGVTDRKVGLTSAPRGKDFNFSYCDVTALSG